MQIVRLLNILRLIEKRLFPVSGNTNLQSQKPPLHNNQILLKILREIARIQTILMHYLMYLNTNLVVEKFDKIVEIFCCGEKLHSGGTHQHGTMLGRKHGYLKAEKV